MIDLKDLRDNPQKYRDGCARKRIPVDIDRILTLDADRRAALTEQERLRSEQRKLEKDLGPRIGRLSGALKKADAPDRPRLEQELAELKSKPTALKAEIQKHEDRIASLQPALDELLLQVPLPPDPDVPIGASSDDNIEIRRWDPPGFDTRKPFESSRGFAPKTHLELVRDLRLADFERGVKLAGARSYILTGDGMRLHQALLRYAVDFMTSRHGFSPMSVPVIVREEAMVGTGFFPAGREQAYQIPWVAPLSERGGEEHGSESRATESRATKGYDLFLTGTGEVGLMGIHQGEILPEESLPLKYVTVSTCFRREAGAAGKDTAGLYRIHQFDKVEQVVIGRADEAESRAWHKKMIGFVEELLQSLGLPYRLLQCCTGDLGVKNADMVDIECWMPGRGEVVGGAALRAVSSDGPANTPLKRAAPLGAYGETHSASRLYDYQCRRLNLRYRPGGEGGKGDTRFCHSLNNTVLASPRIMIPVLEIWQNQDGSVTIPEVLRASMGKDRIGAP